jgi:hypothetical protein
VTGWRLVVGAAATLVADDAATADCVTGLRARRCRACAAVRARGRTAGREAGFDDSIVGVPTAPRSCARSNKPAAATSAPTAAPDPPVGTPTILPSTAIARTVTTSPPIASRPANGCKRLPAIGADAAGPATTACNGPHSPPQNASAPGAAALGSAPQAALFPNGISSSRGPSQSRGSRTTLSSVPGSWPPCSVLRPSVSTRRGLSVPHLQIFSVKP